MVTFIFHVWVCVGGGGFALLNLFEKLPAPLPGNKQPARFSGFPPSMNLTNFKLANSYALTKISPEVASGIDKTDKNGRLTAVAVA